MTDEPIPEPAAMFLSDVEGPSSPEEFSHVFTESLQPSLGEQDLTAGAWTELGDPQRYVLHGWATRDPEPVLHDELGRFGWRALTRIFTALPGLPSSKQQLVVCQIPNNKHVIGGSKVLRCTQQGHTFTDHGLTRCVVDGSLLK